jgi:predicted alpha/beta-fold hydrolase
LAATIWPTRLPAYRAVARRVELDDGDVVVVHDDCPPDWRPGGIATLLMHGLGGCHLSPLLVRLVEKLTARGVRVFRFDMRCCGAGLGLARRPYHAGRSEDLAQVVTSALEWCTTNSSVHEHAGDSPAPSLVLVGVSLSGNILLKYLGEAPERVPLAVTRAVAINPPIDLIQCVATLAGPINRWYDRHFVSSLARHLHEHRRRLPDAPVPTGRPRSRRVYDFDDWFTAPVSGFPNAKTYYERCSAAQFMSKIRVPTLVLTARDDPMIPAAMFESHHPNWPAAVHLAIAAGGGHVGYIARRGIDPDVHWLEWRVIEQVTALQRVLPTNIDAPGTGSERPRDDRSSRMADAFNAPSP